MTEGNPGTDRTPGQWLDEAVALHAKAWEMFERSAEKDHVKILFLSVIACGVLGAATALVRFLAAATGAPPEDEDDG